MDELKAFFALVTPLTLAGGLAYIIYLLVRQQKDRVAAHTELTTNHLHDLPDIAETLRRIERQNTAMAAGILGQLSDIRVSQATIIAKLNGKH